LKFTKVFRDPVHGYINVPLEYCTSFIDDLVFQRLRHIEQTSIRALYPAARHDRFIHSLGVMYLGSKAFSYLKKNTINSGDFSDLSEDKWNIWEQSFKVACLLHDCGHAPFSHTFEKYYETHNSLAEEIAAKCEASDEASQVDRAAPHEKMSALLVLTHFKVEIEKLEPAPDINLVVRMITGWQHVRKDTEEKKIEGCLISLLNGTAIDVDKLDYIMRDTWASGFVNASIDIDRLFSAITLKYNSTGNLVISYKKSALNVLSSVLLARNYLYQWVYYHHKVLYDQWLLVNAVEQVTETLWSIRNEEFEKAVFSPGIFEAPQQVANEKLWMPCDGDFIQLIKRSVQSESGNPYGEEWLSRKHTRKSMWKSFAEYCTIFRHLPLELMESQENEKLHGVVTSALEVLKLDDNNAITITSKPKLAQFTPSNVFIELNGEIESFANLPEVKNSGHTKIPAFFYLYYNRDKISSEAILEQINSEYSKI
jgi:HD superfamily phosphohydrolase